VPLQGIKRPILIGSAALTTLSGKCWRPIPEHWRWRWNRTSKASCYCCALSPPASSVAQHARKTILGCRCDSDALKPDTVVAHAWTNFDV